MLGTNQQAHRVAWILTNGPIPDGMCVLHRCDNPPCVNPDHLWLGTNAENTADMMAKGRNAQPKGEAHDRAKLTEKQVIEILLSTESHIETAGKYGAHKDHIYSIRARRIWKHLQIPRGQYIGAKS